jgi:hypothetical protein
MFVKIKIEKQKIPKFSQIFCQECFYLKNYITSANTMASFFLFSKFVISKIWRTFTP